MPFEEIRILLDGVGPVVDRLLLFLVYHTNLRLNQIIELGADCGNIFDTRYKLPGDDPESKSYFEGLVRETRSTHHPAKYLLEDKNKPYDVNGIKTKPSFTGLLGHRNIKTTERYTRMISDALTTVSSPFDKLVSEQKEPGEKKAPP